MMSLLCKMIPTCESYRVCDKRAQMHAAMRAYVHTYIHMVITGLNTHTYMHTVTCIDT